MTVADTSFTRRVAENKRRAVLLVAVTALLIGVVLALISLLVLPPAASVAVLLIVAGGVAAAAWWGSEGLARRLLKAQPADPSTHARLYNLVEGLCANAGVPQPDLYVVPDPGVNALTMGRSRRHATLVVTAGLLEQLNRIELEGVLAHELSLIKSDDILTATLAVALFGILAAPARAAAAGGTGAFAGYLLLPFSALAGLGLHMAIDPHRQALADTSGVSLTRYPPGLVAALEKMETTSTVVRSSSPATAHLWLSPPATVPSSGRLIWLSRLFETHPPLKERIEALREL